MRVHTSHCIQYYLTNSSKHLCSVRLRIFSHSTVNAPFEWHYTLNIQQYTYQLVVLLSIEECPIHVSHRSWPQMVWNWGPVMAFYILSERYEIYHAPSNFHLLLLRFYFIFIFVRVPVSRLCQRHAVMHKFCAVQMTCIAAALYSVYWWYRLYVLWQKNTVKLYRVLTVN